MLSVLSIVVLLAQPAGPAPQTHTYRQVGDLALQADVFRAPGDEIRPAILWIHGGALIMGHRTNVRRQHLERYLAEGFLVISIDYRLAPETKLPGILDDVDHAWNWIQQQGPKLFRIDPRRVAVIGHSAGGYLTLTTGHRQRPRPRALVSYAGDSISIAASAGFGPRKWAGSIRRLSRARLTRGRPFAT
ncbi:MAG: alpha/beta hydrolase [Bryobacteraceae bacterium]